jgi:radical SAM superfamily enzyme YgiQ (UPF0313 family)
MKVLVIDAFAEGEMKFNLQIGVGPRLIATVISESGVECDLVWFRRIHKNPKILRNYDLILVSGFTASNELIESLSKLASIENPSAVKILGGPIAFDPNDYFKESEFDISVVGEGEKAIVELIKSGFDRGLMKDIKGIAFKDGNEVVYTGQRPPLDKKELARIPDTKYVKAYPFYKFARVTVECVRGCSNFNRPKLELADGTICIECGNCETKDLKERLQCPVEIQPGCGYCCVPHIFGPPRSREKEAIKKEIQSLIDVGVSKISLTAPDLLDYKREELVAGEPLTDPFWPEPNYDEIEKLLSSISALEEVNESVFISLDELKPTLLNERILKILAKHLPGSPLVLVCESGSHGQLNELGRPFPVEKNVELTRIARKLGLIPLTFFINWLPNQTQERTNQTLQLMEKLEQAGCKRMLCYRLAALPATAFYGMKIYEDAELNIPILKKAEELNLKSTMQYLGRELDVVVVKENHKFKPKMKGKKRGSKKGRSFDGALGFLENDSGIFSPLFYIVNAEEKLKTNQKVRVIVDKILSPRAVRASPCD